MRKNMWNDTDVPLAVFFTFRCFGTWLHGDDRGSVDKRQNVYQTPRIERNSNWRKHNEENLRHPPVKLDAARRRSVEKAIRELCDERGWKLLAINVRTNHVHVVVSIGNHSASRARSALKAKATKQLRYEKLWEHDHSPWAEKGSKQNLWSETSIWEACKYVNNEQGPDLSDDDGH